MVAICSRSSFCTFVATTCASVIDVPTSTFKSLPDPYREPAALVRRQIGVITKENPSLSGSILRLAFHDATVRSVAARPEIGGMDGSIRYELGWSENRGLAKPLQIVQQVYQSQLHPPAAIGVDIIDERISQKEQGPFYPLSFADVLALSGAAAVEAANGPKILVKLGRKDVEQGDNRFLDQPILSESDRSSIITSLPSPALDSLGLRNYAKRLGLTEAEWVALSGAHDLGRHVTLTNMPKTCLKNLTRTCLEEAPVLTPFITANPDTLSNRYFEVLLRWNNRTLGFGEAAFIPTDVAMVVDEGLKQHVIDYSKDEELFFQRFMTAYQKLVDSTATSMYRY